MLVTNWGLLCYSPGCVISGTKAYRQLTSPFRQPGKYLNNTLVILIIGNEQFHHKKILASLSQISIMN